MRYHSTIGALGNLLRSVLDDTKYAFFASSRRLGETVAGLVILSAAIGTNVATFGMIDHVLFGTAEGISNSEQVVTLSGNGLYYRTYQDIVDNAGFLSLSGRSGSSERSLGNGPDAELIEVDFVTASYLDVLGVRPLLGRGFLPSDDDPAEGEFGAIISYRFWQTRFGGRPVLAHVYQAYLQSIDILGSYDDSKAQVALQMRTEAGYGGDQTMVLRVPPGAGWMSNAS